MLTLLRYSSVTLREHGLQLAIHFTAQHVIHLPDDTAAAVSGGRAAAAVPVTERSDFTIKVFYSKKDFCHIANGEMGHALRDITDQKKEPRDSFCQRCVRLIGTGNVLKD